MALFSTKSQAEPVKKEKEEQVTLDDILDELDAAHITLKAQTKLIQEMMADLKSLREHQNKLEEKLNENLDAKSKYQVTEYKLFELVHWVQDQFVSLLIQTKEKAAAPKVSPTVQAYLDKKSQNGTKLPLP